VARTVAESFLEHYLMRHSVVSVLQSCLISILEVSSPSIEDGGAALKHCTALASPPIGSVQDPGAASAVDPPPVPHLSASRPL
jgi:hypothetical protein